MLPLDDAGYKAVPDARNPPDPADFESNYCKKLTYAEYVASIKYLSSLNPFDKNQLQIPT